MINTIFLMYHFLFKDFDEIAHLTPGDKVYGLSVDEFSWQIRTLKREGFNCLSLQEYISKSSQNSLPNKVVVITFDDGHISTYTLGAPILLNEGFSAEIFVTTDFIGRSDYMNWAQLIELNKKGLSIQSHTKSHPFLDDLTIPQITEELSQSKAIIEHNLREPCNFFCPSGGRYNNAIKNIAVEIGYKAVCTSIFGFNTPKTDRMKLRRFPILLTTQREEFKHLLTKNSWYLKKMFFRYYLLYGSKKMLGNRVYTALRERIFTLSK